MRSGAPALIYLAVSQRVLSIERTTVLGEQNLGWIMTTCQLVIIYREDEVESWKPDALKK